LIHFYKRDFFLEENMEFEEHEVTADLDMETGGGGY